MDVGEVASGVNENRRGLARLLKAAANGRFDVLLVEHQDRLARFGYRYLVAAFAASGAEVEVVEDGPGRKEPTAELVDDLLAIVMVFAARIYGKRASVVRSKVKATLAEEPLEAAA
jgi:predicted site-specific integrase-resolvase